MLIRVKGDERNFTIRLPNFMLGTRFVSNILLSDVPKQDKPKCAKAMREAYKVMKAYRKKHGALDLVSVQSHDGDNVLIRF